MQTRALQINRVLQNKYMSIFKTLGLSQVIVDSLTDLGYEQPTEIQKISIPQILGSKGDLKAFAQTGTGTG